MQLKLNAAGWKVWIGNGGLDGHSTRGHLVFMEDVIGRVRPDTVIVLAGINDLLYSLVENGRARGSRYDQPGWLTAVYRRSRLAQILYAWEQVLFDRALLVRRSGHGNFQPQPLGDDAIESPADVRARLPGLREYRVNLDRIVDLAIGFGVRPVFMTQPMLFEDSAYWRRVRGAFYWTRGERPVSAATYWRMLDVYNRELLAVCAARRIECIDLAGQMPHSPEYFYDSVHFTEAGAELVARRVAEFLMRRRAQ